MADVLAGYTGRQSSEPVEAIAERLSYAVTSNFSRTVRRWFGVPPVTFRQGANQPVNKQIDRSPRSNQTTTDQAKEAALEHNHKEADHMQDPE